MPIRICWGACETTDAQAPLPEILFQLVQGRTWASFVRVCGRGEGVNFPCHYIVQLGQRTPNPGFLDLRYPVYPTSGVLHGSYVIMFPNYAVTDTNTEN